MAEYQSDKRKPRSARFAASAPPRAGTEHFWRQRLTADGANVPLILFFVGS